MQQGIHSSIFSDANQHPHKPGNIFVGLSDTGQEIGIETDRHAIAIAGARAGKGAAVIIPNLLRWPHNILCIDPSGENVAATYKQLQAAGKKVVLLDPFHEAEKLGVPASLRASVNLFDAIDVNGPTLREDIRMLADGNVVRYKPDDGTWDNGAVAVVASFIAYVMATEPPERRNLSRVRFLLTMPEETRADVFADMGTIEGYGSLCRAGSVIGLSKTKKNQEFIGGAIDQTEWIDSVPMGDVLNSSSFNLAELKTGNVAVFLVVPHDYIEEHKRFLRLFVRAALNVMTKGGKTGRKCLFLLDEFFSLGHIGLDRDAAALPKYGVHLFPFLQDLGQLQKLYGAQGAETFFGNSDAAIFFGNTDLLTLEYASNWIGNFTAADITAAPPKAEGFDPEKHERAKGIFRFDDDIEVRKSRHAAKQQNDEREYSHNMGVVGSRRLPPDQLASIVKKPEGEPISRHAIVISRGRYLMVRLWAYFQPHPFGANTNDNAQISNSTTQSHKNSVNNTLCPHFQRRMKAFDGLSPAARKEYLQNKNNIAPWATGPDAVAITLWEYYEEEKRRLIRLAIFSAIPIFAIIFWYMSSIGTPILGTLLIGALWSAILGMITARLIWEIRYHMTASSALKSRRALRKMM
jgi:hypothetical protein